MQIPPRYREVIDPLIARARSLLEGGETLAAIAFVGSLERNEVTPVVLHDSSEGAKDDSARTISMAASMMGADFVFQVREAWLLSQKHAPRYEDILEKYGSVGASPFAQDVVAFSLETTHGTWVATSRIMPKPPSKKRRTFGPVKFEHSPEISGRFVGLLPRKHSDGDTLH